MSLLTELMSGKSNRDTRKIRLQFKDGVEMEKQVYKVRWTDIRSGFLVIKTAYPESRELWFNKDFIVAAEDYFEVGE
jgi:hypothetical protein